MMVAVGSALTTLLGVFNVEVLGVSWADPMRIGAQVISGIGFLGAGTILLKKGSNQITGLTTAAGLWVTAVSGLAAGAGFYEGAIFVAILTTLIFNMVFRLEHAMNSKRQRVVMYLEIDSVEAVPTLTDILMSSYGAKEVQVTPPRSGTLGNVGMEVLVHIPKHVTGTQKKNELQKLDHVVFALRM
jgi:putative Mg2+ transporter-C (MgtC) family protein